MRLVVTEIFLLFRDHSESTLSFFICKRDWVALMPNFVVWWNICYWILIHIQCMSCLTHHYSNEIKVWHLNPFLLLIFYASTFSLSLLVGVLTMKWYAWLCSLYWLALHDYIRYDQAHSIGFFGVQLYFFREFFRTKALAFYET